MNHAGTGKTHKKCNLAKSHPPVEAAYAPDGVDLTIIRWMLSMSPAQRLATLQKHVESILRLRGGPPGT